MNNDNNFKIEFAPGAFDSFEGTQEELDEIVAEIQRMVREAEENAESDKKAKELIDAKNNAESTTHSINKDYDTFKEQLTEDERTKYDTAYQAVQESLKGEDAEAVQKSVESFFEAAGPVMAKKQQAESANASQPQAEDGVVDAEFKEVDSSEKK